MKCEYNAYFNLYLNVESRIIYIPFFYIFPDFLFLFAFCGVTKITSAFSCRAHTSGILAKRKQNGRVVARLAETNWKNLLKADFERRFLY